MKKVSINNCLVEFQSDTGIETSNNRIHLLRWARKAELEIGGAYSKKVRSVYIEDHNGILQYPSDCICPLMVLSSDRADNIDKRVGILNGKLLPNNISVNANTTFEETDWLLGDTLDKAYTLKYEIQGENIVLYNDYVNGVTLVYYSFETNDNGELMVSENHIEAITMYLKHKIVNKESWGMLKNPKQGFRDLIGLSDKSMRQFVFLCRKARAADAEDMLSVEKEIIEDMFYFPMIQ